MDGFERRKERSKEDIRRAAEELFTKFGADKVSVNDIARQAGVSQATIYNNFGSKEALVHDYRETIAGVVRRRLRDILVLKKSYAEKLQDFFQSWIDMTDRYNMKSGAQGPGGSFVDHTSNVSLDAEISRDLLELIKEVKAKGQPGQSVSEESMLTYIKFFREGMANHPEIQGKMHRDPKLSQELLKLFMYGINGEQKL
jgi:AcrR family transcriptional regulator